MDADYLEMKTVPEMGMDSLNAILSTNRMRRPPSLSESFAWTPENVSRAYAATLALAPSHSPSELPTSSSSPSPSSCERAVVNTAVRFLLHIALISIFESVFFFLYISKLEDNGIMRVIDGFIGNSVNSCRNVTVAERIITNDILQLFLNASTIAEQSAATFAARTARNTALFKQSWIYVGSLGGAVAVVLVYACVRRMPIQWRTLVFENTVMIGLLAAYEYMFFTTIISPFEPLSGDEIAESYVQQLQENCGLLE